MVCLLCLVLAAGCKTVLSKNPTISADEVPQNHDEFLVPLTQISNTDHTGMTKKQGFAQRSKKQRVVVSAAVLNVRNEPSLIGKIVGKVRLGSIFDAVIEGNWAEISPNQFIHIQHLAPYEESPSGVAVKH